MRERSPFRDDDALAPPQPEPWGQPFAEDEFAAPLTFARTRSSGKPIVLFPFGVSRQRLEQAARAIGVVIETTSDVREAEAVITVRSYYRRKPPSLKEAEERNLPIYVVKSNTAYQIEQALLQFRGEDGGTKPPRRDPMADVFRDTEDAIARVMQEGRPIELAPANSYVRRIQHQIATRYNLDSRSSGKEPLRRVRILPS